MTDKSNEESFNRKAAKLKRSRKHAGTVSDESLAGDALDTAIFAPEARKGQARHRKLAAFTSSTTRAAALMLIAAIIALLVANTGGYEGFLAFWETEFGFVFGQWEATMSLGEIINDIFMAVFFLLVGLDIKYEMTVGELTDVRAALLPIMGAVGGVCMPIVIYVLCNLGSPDTIHGWGVPTATDIAFAIGIMALLGNRVPNGVRVFLSTLAVADDIIAILIIAIFYGQSPNFAWLAAVALVTLILVALNRGHVFSLVPYIIVGLVLWFCVFMSGVHSTIAGVILAFTIPTRSRVNLPGFFDWSDKRMQSARSTFEPGKPVIAQKDYLDTVHSLSYVAHEVTPPATRLEHALFPWVYFLILPLFALTNADVSFISGDMGALFGNSAMYGVFFGLLFGKPIGILLMSFILVKLKLAQLPANCNWMHMAGAGILGGVGFTMAIFVANLAFANPADITAAKVGILSASTIAGVLGYLFLAIQAKRAKQEGVVFISTKDSPDFAPTIDAEAARESAKLLESIESTEDRRQLEFAMRQGSGVSEVKVVVPETKE